MSGEDFFSAYLAYTSDTESPIAFHRWSAIAGLGALLGRRYYFQHGHFTVNPNIYCMLIGNAGTRKSTAVKLMKKVLQESGYNTIAADRTTKEKFLMDLAGETGEHDTKSPEDFLDENLFGTSSSDDAESFIMADEFNDFTGTGNVEFYSLLGTLWDYTGSYKNRIKTGKSISIQNPTISILGGNTPTGLSLAFPPEMLGQGFFSRMIFVYGEPNGRKITFPKAPDPRATAALRELLLAIQARNLGPANLCPRAELLLDRIYRTSRPVDDVRFESYSTRRFTHLLKLCLITSAASGSTEISERDVIYANTVLHYTEHFMPKALGEFGKAKHSDVSHKILQLLDSTDVVMKFHDIWKYVANDLEKQSDLATLLQNLTAAEKLQILPGAEGFLPRKKVLEAVDSSVIDYTLLTEEERRVIV